MLDLFVSLLTIPRAKAATHPIKDAIRNTSIQMEVRSFTPVIKFCSQPCTDLFCGGAWSDKQYCSIENNATLFQSGCNGALRTDDPDQNAGGITAILTQGVFCTFYPNKNCNDDVRDPYAQYLQIPHHDKDGKWVDASIKDLRCLEIESTRHGIYTNTGGCGKFLPFEWSWDNKVKSYRCLIKTD